MTNTITHHEIACIEETVCPTCGIYQESIDLKDLEIIGDFLTEQGKDITAIRDLRITATGRALWSHGCGYAIIDDDLLGGSGDGRTERKFRDWYSEKFGGYVSIEFYEDEDDNFEMCDECAGYM